MQSVNRQSLIDVTEFDGTKLENLRTNGLIYCNGKEYIYSTVLYLLNSSIIALLSLFVTTASAPT